MTAIHQLQEDFRPTSVVIIDNFEFQENVQHQIINDKNSFHSYTTDLHVHDQISSDELCQSMLGLTSLNQLNYIHSLQQNQNQIEIELCCYFISEALFAAYLNKLINVFETESGLYSCLVLPEVNKLCSSELTCTLLLKSILMSEGIYDDLYEIFHTVFAKQFKMDEDKNFHESLYLVYGDQKIEKTPFHHLEELVLHSFDAFSDLQANEFDDLISHLYSMVFALKSVCQSDELMERMKDCDAHCLKVSSKTQSNAQSSDMPQLSDENHADVTMTVHVQFLHFVKTYKLIKTGTKHGDVGSTDHFMKTDKLNELLNLKLKKLLQSQRISTFGIQKLFWKSIYTLKYTHQLCQAVEHAFGKYTDVKHIKKSASGDICSLASLISEQLHVSVESSHGFLPDMKLFNAFQNLFSHIATINAYIAKVLEAGGVGVIEGNEKDLSEVDPCREDAIEGSESDQIFCMGIST
ncbi:hypothetical protein LOZ36_002938 [Ophidiomyces ophidiicola]|nr:hypothetical protein LOZ36_002938 [Ophidiomyces ophidiicola]